MSKKANPGVLASGIICLLCCLAAHAGEPKDLALTRGGQSKIDMGVTIEGRWGTFINGKSYQQMPLDTFKGWQYATYYDRLRRLSIARRNLPEGAWEIIHFDDYVYEGNDNHNVTVLGICPNDGTIHLAFDHHGDPLNYRVSKPGVAAEPDTAEWIIDLFSEVRDWLQPGKKITSVTYPRFVPTPQGNLLLVSRDGGATRGKVTLCEYAPAQGGWNERWPVTSKEGRYVFEDEDSNSRYAYLNGVHYDYQTGRLHISWCWRENMGHAFVNLNYAYSDDNGGTWSSSSGRKIGGPGQLIDLHSPGIAVWDIDPHHGLDNQHGQYVDASGRPHIIVWRLRDDEPLLEIGRRDASRSAYYHYWRDEGGTWHQRELPHPVDDTERNRPKILSTPDNDLIGMFNYKGKIVLCGATAKNAYHDWGTLHIEEGPWDGEPLPDLTRWREEGVLSIYMQRDPSQGGEPTDLCVLDFSIPNESRPVRDDSNHK
ncbi:MAG: BNR repeat-containing protein [Planctomycetota bacterium]|jgi:hypothetical protein